MRQVESVAMATGIGAPDRVRGLGHGCDDDNDKSCNNFGDDEDMT